MGVHGACDFVHINGALNSSEHGGGTQISALKHQSSCYCYYVSEDLPSGAPPSDVPSITSCITDDRSLENDEELHFGVHEQMVYARNVPGMPGSQWTGIITQVRQSALVVVGTPPPGL